MPATFVPVARFSNVQHVGKFDRGQRNDMATVYSKIREMMPFFLAKFKFIGVAVCLYCTDDADVPEGSTHITFTNLKTPTEAKELTSNYPNASVDHTNLRYWMPMIRELVYDIIEKSFATTILRGSLQAPYKISGTIIIELPDRTGINVWMDGETSAAERPVFAYHKQVFSSRRPASLLGPSAQTDPVPFVPRFFTTSIREKQAQFPTSDKSTQSNQMDDDSDENDCGNWMTNYHKCETDDCCVVD